MHRKLIFHYHRWYLESIPDLFYPISHSPPKSHEKEDVYDEQSTR
jgi:hypothetical protein